MRRYQYDHWDDWKSPATAINPPGQASDPDWDNTSGGWLFAASGTEQLWITEQITHKWREGTVLKPHVHWEKTTSAAGEVMWQLVYTWAAYLEARTAETTISETIPVANSDVADTMMITALPDISATGRQISDMLVMKLQRIGGDASDTYGADARLLEFDIHAAHSSPGSVLEYEKG